MSEKAKNINPESEDLFSSEEIIIETPFNEEEAVNEVNEGNAELGDKLDENEFMTEMETEAELLEGITEETEQDEEPTENEEAIPVETEISEEVTEGVKTKSAPRANRISELPLSKIKHIIKLDPEVKLVNSEAVYLITKATESFIKSLAKESFTHAAQQKKKTITKSHVDQALTMLPIEL